MAANLNSLNISPQIRTIRPPKPPPNASIASDCRVLTQKNGFYVKATGELELEVKRELVMPDPDKATAIDLLEGADEDSEGND